MTLALLLLTLFNCGNSKKTANDRNPQSVPIVEDKNQVKGRENLSLNDLGDNPNSSNMPDISKGNVGANATVPNDNVYYSSLKLTDTEYNQLLANIDLALKDQSTEDMILSKDDDAFIEKKLEIIWKQLIPYIYKNNKWYFIMKSKIGDLSSGSCNYIRFDLIKSKYPKLQYYQDSQLVPIIMKSFSETNSDQIDIAKFMFNKIFFESLLNKDFPKEYFESSEQLLKFFISKLDSNEFNESVFFEEFFNITKYLLCYQLVRGDDISKDLNLAINVLIKRFSKEYYIISLHVVGMLNEAYALVKQGKELPADFAEKFRAKFKKELSKHVFIIRETIGEIDSALLDLDHNHFEGKNRDSLIKLRDKLNTSFGMYREN